MSHHLDAAIDPALDITDAYCFAGAGDRFGPRTVFGVNTSPTYGKPWNPSGYYELKIDTNGDYVEDITYRATFPIGSDGTQHVQVAELTGAAATNRNAPGRIITPPNAPVGEVVECHHGIKLFAGQRRDPFYNFIPFPVATSKMKPRTWSVWGTNGLALILLMDWRTSSSRSEKDSAAHSGLIPVSS